MRRACVACSKAYQTDQRRLEKAHSPHELAIGHEPDREVWRLPVLRPSVVSRTVLRSFTAARRSFKGSWVIGLQ